uniref:Unconventional prefoldin RPB5 interactor 1 n=1 Tax=Syphacia muris TaxID=451379 RepID=A0A0N5AXJ3_9BILA
MSLAKEETHPRESLNRLLEYVNKVVEHCDKEIEKRKEEISEYKRIKQRLEEMPKKLSYEILVPFGKVGYMPGKLIHTNKVSVLLGDNVFAEVSCFYACQIIDRRLKFIQKTIDDFETQKRMAKSRVEFSSQLFNTVENGDSIEINEPYDEKTEKEWREKRQLRKKSNEKSSSVSENEFEALMNRLDELERQELEELDEDSDSEEVTVNSSGVYQLFLTKELDYTFRLLFAKASEEEETVNVDSIGKSNCDNSSELDSDDLATPPSSPSLVKEQLKEVKSSSEKKKKSVRFNKETDYRIIPSRFSESDDVKPMIAKEASSTPEILAKSKSPSILRNNEEKSPLNEEALEPEKPRLRMSSGKAFNGTVYEKNIDFLCHSQETKKDSDSNVSSHPTRISKFKQMRNARNSEI